MTRRDSSRRAAQLIQRRMRAGFDKAAIARQIRRLVHQQKFQPVGQARHRGDVLGQRLDRAQRFAAPAILSSDRRASRAPP